MSRAQDQINAHNKALVAGRKDLAKINARVPYGIGDSVEAEGLRKSLVWREEEIRRYGGTPDPKIVPYPVGTEVTTNEWDEWGVIESYDPITETYQVSDRTGAEFEYDAEVIGWEGM